MSRRTGRAGWTVALALLATAAGGAGTASGAGDDDAMKTVNAALGRVAEHQSMSFKVSLSSRDPRERVAFTMAGRLSIKGAHRADVTVTFRKHPSYGSRSIVVDQDGYQLMPAAFGLDLKRPWVHTVNDDAADEPNDLLRPPAGSGHARRVGTERLHDRPTTRYRLTADFRVLARTGTKEEKTRARAEIRSGFTRGTSDVWVGSDSLIVRTRLVERGKHAVDRTTTDVRAYDVPLDDIQRPPADQITEFDEAMGSVPHLRRSLGAALPGPARG